MIGSKKVIGVCMTKIHDTPRSRTISYLHTEARKLGYKLMIFNSSFDFYDGLDDDIGAAGIYDFINFDVVDALVILCSGFLDKSVYKKLIARALENNVPIILEDEQITGCYTVKNDYEATLRKLLNHVINEHGIKDTRFLAGFKDNEYSEQRIDVYKSVLAENGIDFTEDMVEYGNFWEGPTNNVIDKWVAENKVPKAIFCANDAMAIACCKRLMMHGYRIPEDVLVTGFDGSKMADFAVPRVSTCVIDRERFAKLCIQQLSRIFEGENVEKVVSNHYSLRLAATCGCSDQSDIDFRQMAEESYHMVTNMIGHEHILYNEIIVRLNTNGLDINSFYSALSKIMNSEACIAFKPSFITLAVNSELALSQVDENLMAIYSVSKKHSAAVQRVKFPVKEIVPDLGTWAEEDDIYIICPVQVGSVTCGYYEDKSSDIVADAQKINRTLNLINMIVHMAISDFRQRFLKLNKGRDSMMDSVTELPNLYGANKWFESFLADSDHRNMAITVSVYELPKYKYIYENYGSAEIEATVCFVAEALRLANRYDSFIAHISDDEFMVINYFEDPNQIGFVIDNAISVFYNMIDNFNQNNGKSYLVEVRNGCAVRGDVTDIKLEQMIKDATAELYKNIHKYGSLPAVKNDITTSKEQYELFNSLVMKNLFKYYFQPIVRVKDGEIAAYEALMRTDEKIGFNPLEVLQIAKEYQRLYDIEKATIFNVMERYTREKEKFGNKKIFVNCIPGYSLKDEDNKLICERFSEHIKSFVFEITEQDTVTDKELTTLRSIGNVYGDNMIAVDDYGVGHSNVVNLINYAPEIVKIDRFLMENIHNDATKQVVVRSVIDFARLNNIEVLAEGIETSEELKKVIELGVDYIQGYYTGRPALEPIMDIDAGVKAEILTAVENRE